MQSNPEWLTTLDAILEIVPSYPPLTGPPAPATLPGLAPAFSFQKEELLLLPVPEVVELVISGILRPSQEPALEPFRRSGGQTQEPPQTTTQLPRLEAPFTRCWSFLLSLFYVSSVV